MRPERPVRARAVRPRPPRWRWNHERPHAQANLREAEGGALRRNDDVRVRHQPESSAERRPAHRRDDRHREPRADGEDALVRGRMLRGIARQRFVQIHARAEDAAARLEQDRADRGSRLRVFERVRQFAAQRRLSALRFSGRFSVTRRTRSSRLISKLVLIDLDLHRSIAAPSVLPCASTRSDTVPPPPSASCSRKFSAPMLASSNRSTRPFTSSPKMRATRSAVTSRSRMG